MPIVDKLSPGGVSKLTGLFKSKAASKDLVASPAERAAAPDKIHLSETQKPAAGERPAPTHNAFAATGFGGFVPESVTMNRFHEGVANAARAFPKDSVQYKVGMQHYREAVNAGRYPAQS